MNNFGVIPMYYTVFKYENQYISTVYKSIPDFKSNNVLYLQLERGGGQSLQNRLFVRIDMYLLTVAFMFCQLLFVSL